MISPGTQTQVVSNLMFQHESSFLRFLQKQNKESHKSKHTLSKRIGGSIRDVGQSRAEKSLLKAPNAIC